MLISRPEATMYAGWFRCVADPTRIMILNLLAAERRPVSVGEIVASVDVGQSTVSHHLSILEETAFVVAERRGNASYFRVNEECFESFPAAAAFVMARLARPEIGKRPEHPPWQASGKPSGREPAARNRRSRRR